MAMPTILFVGDRFHYSQTAPSVYSVSGTANGYNRESVRYTDWQTAWKPADSTNDEYIQIDGGSAGWLGTTGGDTIYAAIAYDARGVDQATIKVLQDGADNPAGAFITSRATFTVDTTGPTVDYATFPLSVGGKRYYRIMQYNTDRGGGSRTIPIYAVALFTGSEAFIIDTDYASDTVGESDFAAPHMVAAAMSATGLSHTNRNGRPAIEFEVPFDKATTTIWNDMMTNYMTWNNGPSIPIWVQFEGLYNPARDGFALAHMVDFTAARAQRDATDTRLRFRTSPGPL